VNAQHSSATYEHGTPPEFVELARRTLGTFYVDPASSPGWNRLVGAETIITREQDGRRTPWFPGAPAPNRLLTDRSLPTEEYLARRQWNVFLNTPNTRDGALAARFWVALADYFERRWATSAIWVGFNVEQLARLQRVGARSHPLEHVTLVPAKRAGYRPSPASLAVDEEPPHASFVTLLTRSPSQIETFAAFGGELGFVINGDRR